MSAFDDAKSLVQHTQEELPKIKQAYDASLAAKTIAPPLLVEIKNVCENLRSALDFTAHGLLERHCVPGGKKPKIYFPYATAKQSRVEFEKSGRIETCIPGLAAKRPDLADLLLEMQHFGSKGYKWLPIFMDLTNENKHQRLVPQIRKESKELRISGGGAAISLGQGASIFFRIWRINIRRRCRNSRRSNVRCKQSAARAGRARRGNYVGVVPV